MSDNADKLLRVLAVLAAAFGLFMFGYGVGADSRLEHGCVSDIDDVIKDGHTYEKVQYVGVARYLERKSGQSERCVYVMERPSGNVPDEFTVINGCIVKSAADTHCSFVEIDPRDGTIVNREGEGYGDYAERCRNFRKVMDAQRKPTEVQP